MRTEIPQEASRILERLHERGYEAYIVGGCVRDMIAVGAEFDARWFSAGKRSKRGHPHHPLYLRRDSPLDPFDAAAYLSDCLGPV